MWIEHLEGDFTLYHKLVEASKPVQIEVLTLNRKNVGSISFRRYGGNIEKFIYDFDPDPEGEEGTILSQKQKLLVNDDIYQLISFKSDRFHFKELGYQVPSLELHLDYCVDILNRFYESRKGKIVSKKPRSTKTKTYPIC